MNIKSFLLATIALVFAFAASAANPRNVILFIGDGMSTPQRMTADEFARKMGRPELVMNRLPFQATTRTCSANSLVTDSAAAATAIACGEKTYNGAVGVNAGTNRIFSSACAAKDSGRKVGIVTSVTINHATPAGFYGHRKSRGEGYGLGLDLLASGFDYFAGGGLDGHDDKKNAEYKGDIYALAKDAGYTFVKKDAAAFRALKPGAGKVWYVASGGSMPFAIDADRWADVPTLAELTAKGIELLENEKGFFLMVEGGMVDWAGHANDAATNLRDVLALDDAVKVALGFQEKHPDETLVVVTGDHETGGMSMGFAGIGGKFKVEVLATQKISTEKFSHDVKKLIADRKGEIAFDEVKPLVAERFGLDKLSAQEEKALRKAFETDVGFVKAKLKDTTAHDVSRRYVFAQAVKNALNARAGIGWSSGSHTALPTLTTAKGAGAEILVGMIENSDLGARLKSLIQ